MSPSPSRLSLIQRWKRWREDRLASRTRGLLARRCPRALVLQQALPAGLRSAWDTHAEDEFPGLPRRESDWLQASTGLMQFFLAASAGDGPHALPSRAADAVWHAWLHWDAAGLADFQREHLHREVPHLKESELPGVLDHALARCFAACCRQEGTSPLDGRLPLVFELDRELRMPGGWHYTWNRRRRTLSHQVMDVDGDPRGRVQLHAAHGAALMSLGLLTVSEQALWSEQMQRMARKREEAATGGSACGSSCGGSAADCSPAGDCSSGSSCGSSCGGGGGGGGD